MTAGPAARAAMRALLTIAYCDQVPTAMQAAFLLDWSREALYGGAAGGGKSSALLMAALQPIEVPGYAAIIFRRTLTDLKLPGGLLDRARQWIGTRARWSADEHTWTFPSGATLSFGYLDNTDDHLRYQGAEFQYIAFDELTQFRGAPLPVPVLPAATPRRPGPAPEPRTATHASRNQPGWGRSRLGPTTLHRTLDRQPNRPERRARTHLLPCAPHRQSSPRPDHLPRKPQPTRPRHPRATPGRQLGHPPRRAPLPARLVPQRTSQRDPDRRHLRPLLGPRRHRQDPGRDPDYTVGALVARDHDGHYHLLDIVRVQASPATVEHTVRATAETDGKHVQIHIEQEPGASGNSLLDGYRTRVLDGYTVRADVPSGNKIVRAQPVATRAEAGDLTIVSGTWNDAFLDEAELFPDPTMTRSTPSPAPAPPSPNRPATTTGSATLDLPSTTCANPTPHDVPDLTASPTARSERITTPNRPLAKRRTPRCVRDLQPGDGVVLGGSARVAVHGRCLPIQACRSLTSGGGWGRC